MSAHDFSALYDHYPEVIDQMPEEFTSHEFILRLAQRHQDLYVDALYSYRTSLHEGVPAPFKAVHSVLASHLHKFDNLLAHIGNEDNSTDIFGQSNSCAKWRKL